MKKNSRGLSTIVATLLIILLVLVAVGIIWVVVRNVVQGGSEQISLGKFTLDLEIAQVQKINDSSLNVKVKRNTGEGKFVGINFIIDDGSNTEVVKTNVSLKELEEKNFELHLLVINASRIKKISIVPVFRLESGKEVNGDVKDEYIVSTAISGISSCTPYCPSGSQCGSDGCSGSCGICSGSTPNCINYQCSAQVCTPSCVGKICGSDGCSGSCGTCTTGFSCTNSVCTLIPATEEQKIIGIFFSPSVQNYSRNGTYTNYNHSIFIQDFSSLVDTLSDLGFNTIVFNMDYSRYDYVFDDRFNNSKSGFNESEVKEMARIVRNKDMNVLVSLQVLTHQDWGMLYLYYPEYLLEGSNGSTRDPFNAEGEQKLFGMIDELIGAFTVDGEKPEGFHICSDELSHWVNCSNSVNCNGMNESAVFAMAITNVYNHIKQNNSDMKVIMWGDMLDENWNGGNPQTPVAGAVDLLPRDIIIDDWRYEKEAYYGYDVEAKSFPSVEKFIDKGYKVLVSPWYELDSAKDLIWTGKNQDIKTGNFMGVIYTTWLSYDIPSLNHALTGYPANWRYLIPESYKNRTTPPVDEMYIGISDTIKNTSGLIYLEECSKEDNSCGVYPQCEDCNIKNGNYSGEYRDYFCENNQCKYNILNFPSNYFSYWKFEDNVLDESGINNGQIYGDCTFVEGIDGKGMSFDGNYDRIRANPITLNQNNFAVFAWIYKTGTTKTYVPLVEQGGSTKFRLIYYNGRLCFGNDSQTNNFYCGGSMAIENRWYFVGGVVENGTIKLYIDGVNLSYSQTPGNYGSLSENFLYIGDRNYTALVGSWNGTIDEVMIFNRSLSSTEVQGIKILEYN